MYYCDDDPAFSNAVYDALIAAGQAATVPCIRRVRICRDGPEPVREIRTVHLPTPDQLTAGLRPADLVVHREVLVECERGTRIEEHPHLPALLAEDGLDALITDLATEHDILVQGGGNALRDRIEHLYARAG